MNKNFCHISTVHITDDTRIYHKEISSLSQFGFHVYYITPFYKNVKPFPNVTFLYINRIINPYFRIIFSPVFVLFKIKSLPKIEIYHLHDPELVFVGIILRIFGAKVILDLHEDVPKQIISKVWLPKWIRIVISQIYSFIGRVLYPFFSFIFTASNEIALGVRSKKIDTIYNYPILNEFSISTNPKNLHSIIYIGTISEIRGIVVLLDALGLIGLPIRLILVGAIQKSLLEKLKAHNAWIKVDYVGFKERKELNSLFDKSFAGIVTFLPEPNHVEALPNKLFEYMAAGLPVIASDFKKWENIVTLNNVGICVNPSSSEELANAITFFFNNPKTAQECGRRGFDLVKEKYNWESEEVKLITTYSDLIGN